MENIYGYGLMPVSFVGFSQNVPVLWLARRFAKGTWSKVGNKIGDMNRQGAGIAQEMCIRAGK